MADEHIELVDGIKIQIVDGGKSYDFEPKALLGVGISQEGGEEPDDNTEYRIKVMIGGSMSEAGVANGMMHLLHSIGRMMGYELIGKIVYEFAYECAEGGVLEHAGESSKLKTKNDGSIQ